MHPLKSQENKKIFEDIIVAVWYDIDCGDATTVQYFFTPDAQLWFGDRLITGRQDIHDGYQSRRARGKRVSRHVISNVHVIEADDNRARVISNVRLYAADGEPVLPNTTPLSVGDTLDTFVRADDGSWLIAERHIDNLFVDPQAVFAEPPSK